MLTNNSQSAFSIQQTHIQVLNFHATVLLLADDRFRMNKILPLFYNTAVINCILLSADMDPERPATDRWIRVLDGGAESRWDPWNITLQTEQQSLHLIHTVGYNLIFHLSVGAGYIYPMGERAGNTEISQVLNRMLDTCRGTLEDIRSINDVLVNRMLDSFGGWLASFCDLRTITNSPPLVLHPPFTGYGLPDCRIGNPSISLVLRLTLRKILWRYY